MRNCLVFRENPGENTGTKKKQYFQIYTVVFVIMALFVCSWFYLTGRTFVWQGDGWKQHYPALVYYAKYLRSIIRSIIFEHKLVIPAWDFSIGEGGDILETLHYYVIGDPFSFFSVLVPTRFLHLYYGAMILLRLYFAGIAFSCFCFQTGRKNRYGILAGTMTYIFCYWALYNIARHPYFLNPMIYFPMLLIGIEKILKKERPYLFIIAVFLSAVSNFYFFYMLVLLTVLYVAVRILVSYRKEMKTAVCLVFRIGAAAVLGLLLAAVIFLPICHTFLSDARMSAENAYHLFYPLSYYSRLPGLFLAEGESYWMCMGFSAPVLLAVILLFRKHRKFGILKVFFGISVLIMAVPFLGQVLNGFSYQCNRWCWAFAFLCAYILTEMWSFLMDLRKKEAVVLSLGTFAYFAVCLMLEYSRNKSVFAAVVFAFFFLFLAFPLENGKGLFAPERKQLMALLVVMVSIFCNSFWAYASGGDHYASEALESRQVTKDYLTNEAEAVKQAAQSDGVDGFYRYSGRGLLSNAGFRAGISSTQFFWTLSNPYVSQFRQEMELSEGLAFNYSGYDGRTALVTLASVLYYVVPKGGNVLVPYGFSYMKTIDVNENSKEEILEELKKELQTEELSEEQVAVVEKQFSGEYRVYKNNYALPLVYAYEDYLTADTWNTLSAVEKQEALLQAIVLEDYEAERKEVEPDLTSSSVDYTITGNSSEVTVLEDAIVVTSANASVTITCEGLADSETYLSIENLSFQGTSVYDLYWGNEETDPLNLYNVAIWNQLSQEEQESMRKQKLFWDAPKSATLTLQTSAGGKRDLVYYTEDYSYYNNRHDFTVNLDYSEEEVTQISITFSNAGIYSFDSIEVICQPMNHYTDQIRALGEDQINVETGTDFVSGTVTLKQPKILCFAIPYSDGWTALVDGKEVPLYRANSRYMGLPVNAGEHRIQLVYHNSLLKIGIGISCFASFLFLFYVISSERRRRLQQIERKM